ncbi:MAG TPA: ATP-binding protein [Streptosporangiaceae bacterium]|nr:ATP-binding protein [Streptosporangiaceae bacterium]
MVGRDRELARVTTLLADALPGRRRLVLCTGEAGIGKTRLAEEIAVSAAAGGVAMAWACATDRDSSPPYGLWRLVLSEPAVRAGADSTSSLDSWSHVLGDAERPTLPDGVDSGSAQRFALFRRDSPAVEAGGRVATCRGLAGPGDTSGGIPDLLDDPAAVRRRQAVHPLSPGTRKRPVPSPSSEDPRSSAPATAAERTPLLTSWHD